MSVRKTFVKLLHNEMRHNKKIILVLGDLGYGHFDKIREELFSKGILIEDLKDKTTWKLK